MLKHKRSSKPGTTALPALDAAFERALIDLLECNERDTLIAAGRRLLEVLAPQSHIALGPASDDASASCRNGTLTLPLGAGSQHSLRVDLAEGMDQAEFERRIALVARLLGAKDDQIRSLRHLRDSVHRLERAERLQRALYTITEQANSERDMADVMRAMHQIIGSLMYADNFYIVLYDDKTRTVRFPYFVDVADPNPPPPDTDLPMAEIYQTPTWYLIHDAKPLMGPPEALRKQVGGTMGSIGPEPVDWLGVPLMDSSGEHAVGALVVQSYREDTHYSAQDRALLSYVAQHVRTTLERHRAHAELSQRVADRTRALTDANRVLQQQVMERQRGERLQAALFRIAELASSSDSPDDFYAAVHRVVGGLLYARNFYIALVTSDGGELHFPYSVDEFDTVRKPRKFSHGLTEYVLEHHAALLADSDTIQRMYDRGTVTANGTGAVCWLGVPLICGATAVGVIAVQSYSVEHRYTLRDQELLTFVSYHIANALERKRNSDSLKRAYAELEQRVGERTRELAEANRDLRQQITRRERIEQRLKYETLHDALTGLPNRSMLLRRLGQALDECLRDPSRSFAVLFLDLDRFKIINDSVGHMVGDDLLFQAGGRIRSCLKSVDVVARLGGDEFAVLLENVTDSRDADRVAERVLAELARPFRIGAKELFTSASIGIALSAPHYRRAEELLRDADTAMYRAKAEGRQRYARFDERMRREATSLLDIESDLRRALTRHEFVPYFQPVVRLDNRAIVGYEALLRWRHPQRGLLAPDDFLYVAEDNGTDVLIDWQIFEQVLTVAPQLICDGRFISINLSGRHFRSARLEQRLLELFDRHGVDPPAIRIEVTERALLDNPPQVRRTLEHLGEHGIGIALDDFGTGYSSLSYLHQYPLQTLKVDRSFVISLGDDAHPGSTPIVRAILALAASQGMQVIAEGIETERERAILASIGCEFGQGFLFSEAQPAEHWLPSVATV